MPDDRILLTNWLMRDKRTVRAMATHSIPRATRQVAVASTDSRIGNTHSRVTYFEERDMEAYFVTDEELAELCRLAGEQTINLADDKLTDIIDRMGASASGRVFL